MAKRAIPPVDDDFSGVRDFLSSRGIVPSVPRGQMIALAKRLHHATYSLILWRFRLKGLPVHSSIFLEEIASDALQILPQGLMGYGKTVQLLIRGIVENTVRHLYFTDHPIEFERMNREKKWYPDNEELFTYHRVHPRLVGLEEKFDAFNRLKTLFDDLSASVHGRRIQDLEMRLALEKIAYNETTFESQVKLTEACACATNFLLMAFHADKVHGFQKQDKRILLRLIPQNARKVLADHP